jgi:D-threo-aldose 1-dehydrogenase
MTAASTIRKFTTRKGRALNFTTLGFGSAPLGNYLRSFTEDECDATVRAAWAAGLRYYDTAPLYGLGLSEDRVGRILRQHPRDQYLLSTKVGRLLEPLAPGETFDAGIFVDVPAMKFTYDYSYDAVMRSFEGSLKRMGIDRVDILLVHDVDGTSHGGRAASEARIQELMKTGGWKAVDELRASGVVDAVGIGVNEWEPCARMLELADPDLFLLAGRYTLLEQAPLGTLFPQCEKQGAAIILGGPYNSGVLAGKTTFNYGEIPDEVAKRVAKLRAVCDAHRVNLRDAALQFVAAHPLVVSVIPGAVSPQEVANNVAILEEKIPAALWADLRREGLLHPRAPTPGGAN